MGIVEARAFIAPLLKGFESRQVGSRSKATHCSDGTYLRLTEDRTHYSQIAPL